MSPKDARQFRQMLNCITDMRRGATNLVQGADSLLFLRSALEAVEEAWSDEFSSHVATLESAGLATSAQVEEMGSRFQAVVSGALDSLETMVLARFPVPPTDEDEGDGI